MSAAGEQTDFGAAKGRSLKLGAIGLAFVVVPALFLLFARGPERTMVAVVAMGLGIALGAGALALVARDLLRAGPAVSVGPHGLHDRRLSTGWIPWAAIRSATTLTLASEEFLLLEVDPADDAALPFKRHARRVRRLNERVGYGDGYWMATSGIAGGAAAILEAMRRHASLGDAGR